MTDIQAEVEKVRKTLGDLKAILDQLDKARSVVCVVENLTDAPLTYVGSDHDHGGFAATPPSVINAHAGGGFGSQSSSGSLFTGTEGWVRYVGLDGMGVRFHWDNPWAGSNSSDATLDGNSARVLAWSETGNGDQKAEMRFVVLQLPFPVFGAIRDKWAGVGGIGSPLRLPVTGEIPTFDGVGRYQNFQGGIVSWHPETNAHIVWGLIGERWLQIGREQFGYPITDETATPDGSGRFNHFKAVQLPDKAEASIYWHPNTGAHEVYGAIRAKWAEMGWERSPLGYPLDHEQDQGGGRIQRFQGGALFWTPQGGVVIR